MERTVDTDIQMYRTTLCQSLMKIYKMFLKREKINRKWYVLQKGCLRHTTLYFN